MKVVSTSLFNSS